MTTHVVRTVLDGLYFGEGPRWHDGSLWFSDMHDHRVVRTDLDGNATTVVTISHDEPSGLGWLPDGRLLFVAMETQRLLRLEHDGTVVEHADLSHIARGSINDMIVAADGTAYVGDMGSRIHDPSSPRVAGPDHPRRPRRHRVVCGRRPALAERSHPQRRRAHVDRRRERRFVSHGVHRCGRRVAERPAHVRETRADQARAWRSRLPMASVSTSKARCGWRIRSTRS